jgi:hypothetical protein
MELEVAVLERVRTYESLSRWERSELGRNLRRLGLSYGEIMDLIPVKKSTLATWCRDVNLTESQIEAIKKRRPPTPGTRIAGLSRNTQWKRHAEIEVMQAQAKVDAEHLIDDALWLAGTVLYWGEGFKTQNQLGMANSDPHALRLFIAWADRFHLPATGFRAKLNLHADNDEPRARQWWSDQLDIPLGDFNKTFLKPDGTGHRKNHLQHGVCLVTKRRCADAFHTTMAWIEFLQGKLGS